MSKPAQRDLVRFRAVLKRGFAPVVIETPAGSVEGIPLSESHWRYVKRWEPQPLKTPLEGFLVRHTVLSDGYSESLGEGEGYAWTVTGTVPCWVVQPWGRRKLAVFVLESDLDVVNESD